MKPGKQGILEQPNKRELFISLFEKGVDRSEIAVNFGRSARWVNHNARRLGLSTVIKENVLSSEKVKEILSRDTSLERASSEAHYYKRLYKEAIKERTLQDTLVEAIREIAPSIPKVTVETLIPRSYEVQRGSETDVLQLSDLHGGEVVSLEETMGLSSFDMTILNRRLDLLFRKVLELVEIRRSALYIPKLLIAELGDLLSGDIHAELVRTNIDHVMNLATRIAFLVSQGIAFIAPHFERIDVECVVGNHPRLYDKPSYKEKYINWDYLCYQWQAVFCSSLSNVYFHIPKSPFSLTKVENTKVLIWHGDQIKSWAGIPWYGIERAALRLRELLQSQNRTYDALLLGHFHNEALVAKATGPIVINGSVKGGDEFSLGSYQSINKPSQNLLFFHNKNGYIGGQPIYLNDADKNSSLGFKDFLTDNWVDLKSHIS